MKNISLHPRQRKLIYVLNASHGILKGKELAARLGISERTIRSDISEINRLLEPNLVIQAVYGKGYILKMEDRKIFHELFSKEDNIETKEDRSRYLTINLIKEGNWVDLAELEETLFVSRSTLENDIKTIKCQITNKSPYLKLERKGNEIRFESDEDKQRRLLIRLYCENWDYDSREGIVLKDEFVNQDTLNQVRIVLKNVLRNQNIMLDDFGLIYMTMAIAISYSRIIEGHDIEEEERTSPVADTIWDILSAQWDLQVSKAERSWTEKILDQAKILGFNLYSREAAEKVTCSKTQENVDGLIMSVKDKFNIDFSKDDTFKAALLLHLQALENNMMSVQEQNKYVLEAMAKEYSKLQKVAYFMREEIEKLYDINLGLAEEGYLLPLIAPAWDKLLMCKLGGGIPTVVVSHLNAGLTEFLIYRLKQAFGKRVRILGALPIYDKNKIDEMEPMLIVSTAAMDGFRTFNVPMAITSPLLDKEEAAGVEREIEKVLDNFGEYV